MFFPCTSVCVYFVGDTTACPALTLHIWLAIQCRLLSSTHGTPVKTCRTTMVHHTWVVQAQLTCVFTHYCRVITTTQTRFVMRAGVWGPTFPLTRLWVCQGLLSRGLCTAFAIASMTSRCQLPRFVETTTRPVHSLNVLGDISSTGMNTGWGCLSHLWTPKCPLAPPLQVASEVTHAPGMNTSISKLAWWLRCCQINCRSLLLVIFQ